MPATPQQGALPVLADGAWRNDRISLTPTTLGGLLLRCAWGLARYLWTFPAESGTIPLRESTQTWSGTNTFQQQILGTSLGVTGQVIGGATTASLANVLFCKQTADSFGGAIAMQRNATLDTWAFGVAPDNGWYLGYANNASGADAAGDFTTALAVFPSAPATPGATQINAGAGELKIGATTASSSTITGALTVAGGVGIGGVANFGDNISVTKSVDGNLSENIDNPSAGTSALTQILLSNNADANLVSEIFSSTHSAYPGCRHIGTSDGIGTGPLLVGHLFTNATIEFVQFGGTRGLINADGSLTWLGAAPSTPGAGEVNIGGGEIYAAGTARVGSFAVASLPAGVAGAISFANNGRKNGEGAGAGTGVLVFHDGTAWRACDTGATVAA